MNTSKIHTSLAALSFVLINTVVTGAPDYHLSLEATVSSLDTGHSTETVVAPQVGLSISVGEDDTHRIGIAYSHLSFDDRIEWISDEPPFPDRIDAIIDTGSVTIDQFKLTYRVNLGSMTDGIRIFITPSIGIGRISESGTHTVVGGITGGFTQPFDQSEWKVNASGSLGFDWDLNSNWRFALSAGYMYQATQDAMLYTKLNGPQGTASFTYSF